MNTRLRSAWAFCWGSLIGTLGGLIGLGGAEFRLPVLIGFFRYPVLDAVVINLIVSLVTVFFSLIFRTGLSKLNIITEFLPVILNIIAGSLVGSYLGVHLTTRLSEHTLKRLVGIALILLSFFLISHDYFPPPSGLDQLPQFRFVLGLVAGLVIGFMSSSLGIAGGELIIPTLTVLFGMDIKVAGTLSLAISIPTLLVGLSRYYSHGRLTQVHTEMHFILWMSLGSIAGALLGTYLLQFVSSSILSVLLGFILLLSAFRLLREKDSTTLPSPESTPD